MFATALAAAILLAPLALSQDAPIAAAAVPVAQLPTVPTRISQVVPKAFPMDPYAPAVANKVPIVWATTKINYSGLVATEGVKSGGVVGPHDHGLFLAIAAGLTALL